MSTIVGITGEARSSFLKDIFGDDQNEEKGLVDCISKEQFDSKFFALRNIWDKRECKAREITDPKIFEYFNRNVADAMKERMLLSVRRSAGLKENFFYNNASESMNDRIKKRIRQIKKRHRTIW
jgi:hypothetical protein